jgi:hypothetical protein
MENTMMLDLGLPPPVGIPVGHRVSPVVDVVNPGTVTPGLQTTKRMSVDQTRSVTISGSSLVNSNGQIQRIDKNPGQQGVTVTSSPAPLATNSNGNAHMKNMGVTDSAVGVTRGPGLPVNVDASSQNFARPIRTWAAVLPTPVTRDGGAFRPGRLPTDHNIK